jgi:hypothetical protein
MLVDQGLEPTALNWITVCNHFLSLPLIRVERAAAFRLLRQAIERAALLAVLVDAGRQKEPDREDPGPLTREELVALVTAKEPGPLTREELVALITAKSSAVELLVLSASGSKDWRPAKITGWATGRTAVHIEIKRLDGSPMYFTYGVAEATRVIRRTKGTL